MVMKAPLHLLTLKNGKNMLITLSRNINSKKSANILDIGCGTELFNSFL